MWTIGEVKRAGWAKVKNYYWPALVVALVAGLFSGVSGGSSSRSVSKRDEIAMQLEAVPPAARYIMALTVLCIILAVMLILFLLKTFVGNPVLVGKSRFFMESRSLNASAGIKKVGWAFSKGRYLNVVKIMFFRDLYTFLWTLLLIFPGVIKAYEYQMIPYILSENPEADKRDVFALTRDMMSGSKFHYFLLEVSFIGWYLLGLLACCVGAIFVCPYEEAAYAEVYASMRTQTGGFPFNGFGVEEEVDMEDVYQRVMNSDTHYGDNDRL